MKKILLVLSCFVALSVGAQNREIIFKDADWKTQLAAAKKENKLIFFDAYTSWCGPCRMMAKDVFTRDSVADMFNQSFINVKYDMEKGEGVVLKQKYDVKVYPTYLFINGDGEIVYRLAGSMAPDVFMKEALNALNPESTLIAMANKFNSGNHSEAIAIKYIDMLQKAYELDKASEVAKIYFDGLEKSSLLEEHNWNLALNYLTSPPSHAFAYLYVNKDNLIKKYGVEKVEAYFQETFQSTVYAIRNAYGRKQGLTEAKENMDAMRKLLNNKSGYAVAILAKLDIIEYQVSGQWDKFVERVNKVLVDTNFTFSQDFAVDAANDLVSSAPSKYYDSVLKWTDVIEKSTPDLFKQIQIFDLRKRVYKRQGKIAESEAMAKKADELRQTAVKNGQMTPPMYNN